MQRLDCKMAEETCSLGPALDRPGSGMQTPAWSFVC